MNGSNSHSGDYGRNVVNFDNSSDNSSSNHSGIPSTHLIYYRSVAELAVGSFTFFVIMIMTVVGNVLVILSVLTYRPLKKVQNYFLVSLACADLCVATLVMPFHVVKFILGEWIFGLALCQAWLTFDILLCTASILNLCAIALDRYWAITNPITYCNKRTPTLVISMIVVVWTLSSLISVPPLIGWNDWTKDHLAETCELTTDKAFVVYSASGSFYIPLSVMTTVYIKIFLAARKRLRKRGKTNKQQREHFDSKIAQTNNSTVNGQTTVSLVANNTTTETTPMLRRNTTASTTDQKSSGSQEDDETGNVNDNDNSAAGNFVMANEMAVGGMDNSSAAAIKQRNQSVSNGGAAASAGTTRLMILPPVVKPLEMLNVQKIYKERERISVTKEKKAAKTLAIIMGVFVLCWLPFFLIYIIKPFCNCVNEPKIEEVITWLGYINSALNPVIYTIFNMDFRRAFHKYLCFWIPPIAQRRH